MKLDAFDYVLPSRMIARSPTEPREAARLLDLSGDNLIDRRIGDLPSLLQAGDVVVVNNTKVIPARLSGKLGMASISVTLHKRLSAHVWRVFAKPAKKCRIGELILFADDFAAVVQGRGAGGDVELGFINPSKTCVLTRSQFDACLDKYGGVPLPPYIARPNGQKDSDKEDYQTMFAKHRGAVAAPTAGLHFTRALAKRIVSTGVKILPVTLHVGAGTFLPVTVNNIDDHKMHSEWGEISSETAETINATRVNGGRVIAVGTTSLRILEACYQQNGTISTFTGETDIFIKPGFEFRVIDGLLTNFHLPKSTLLMLVSAFAGMRRIAVAYRHAIVKNYRFFSYGDACFITRNPCPDVVDSIAEITNRRL